MDAEEEYFAPIFSLDEIVEPEEPSTKQLLVLFPTCRATPAEADACHRRARRCLHSPIFLPFPSHEARAALLDALAAELHAADAPPLDPPLPPLDALSRAIADAEAQLALCRAAAAAATAAPATRLLEGEANRVRRREQDLVAAASRLRAQLALEHERLAQESEEGSTPPPSARKGTLWGGGLVRSLSFERKKKPASSADAIPKEVARTPSSSGARKPAAAPAKKVRLGVLGCTLGITRKAKDAAAEVEPPVETVDAVADPVVLERETAARSFEVLLFALISISQRRMHELSSARGHAPPGTPGEPAPLPLNPAGNLRLLDPEEAGTSAGRSVASWLLDAFALHFGVSEAARALAMLSAALGDRQGLEGGTPLPEERLQLARDALRATLQAFQLDLTSAAPASAAPPPPMPPSGSTSVVDLKKKGSRPPAAPITSPSVLMKRASGTWRLGRVTSGRASDETVVIESVPELGKEGGAPLLLSLELRAYHVSARALYSHAEAVLPTLLADLEEDATGASARSAALVELFVQNLALLCRLRPTGVGGSGKARGGAVDEAADDDGGWGGEAAGGAPDGFVWDEAAVPAALAARLKRLLRTAVQLQCEQEMRAAMQTARAAAQRGGRPPPRGGGAPLVRMLAIDFRAAAAAAGESTLADRLGLELTRLRRLRERLERSLGAAVRLVGAAVGGRGTLVRVFANVLLATVFAPLKELCVALPLELPSHLILRLAREHHRVYTLLCAAMDGAAAEAEGGQVLALTAMGERGHYSPFVYRWLEQVFPQLAAWLRARLAVEPWTHHHSPTLRRTFRLCGAVASRLREVEVLASGEAVAAAQMAADVISALAHGLRPAEGRGGAEGAASEEAEAKAYEQLEALVELEGETRRRAPLAAADDEPPWERAQREVEEAEAEAAEAAGGRGGGGAGGGGGEEAEEEEEAGEEGRLLRVRCVLASNAWEARMWLEVLAAQLEAPLRAHAEQRAILEQSFGPAFSALRGALDEQLAAVLAVLRRPVDEALRRGLDAMTSRPAGGGKRRDEAPPRRPEWLVGARGVEESLARVRRHLLDEVARRLLQRLWGELLEALAQGLHANLYVPRALGDAFAVAALELLDALAATLATGAGSPSAEWLRRKAAPLRSALQLAALPTPTLLAHHRGLPRGLARSALVAALSLRMDDPLAAALVSSAAAEEADASLEETGGSGASANSSIQYDGSAILKTILEVEPALQRLIDAQRLPSEKAAAPPSNADASRSKGSSEKAAAANRKRL
ncbi:hypothetical protein AB1Y20_022447 [Prymnesium parvum]|uniref:Uncharacterized protein n=1 Tax=Prymnesium parvum TaxID=97485 RepID=A0AB34JHL1_PRYPA